MKTTSYYCDGIHAWYVITCISINRLDTVLATLIKITQLPVG